LVSRGSPPGIPEVQVELTLATILAISVQMLEGPLRWSAADGEDTERRASVALGHVGTKSVQLRGA